MGRAQRYSALLMVALAVGNAAAQNAMPQLLEFDEGQVALGAKDSAKPMTPQAGETLAALRTDPRVSELRVGWSAGEAAIEAKGFSLSLRNAQTPAHVEGLEVTTTDGTTHLYRYDAETGHETSIVVRGDDMLGRVRTGTETWRLAPLGEQALRSYLRVLAPDGVIAVHITNRHLNLEPPPRSAHRTARAGRAHQEARAARTRRATSLCAANDHGRHCEKRGRARRARTRRGLAPARIGRKGPRVDRRLREHRAAVAVIAQARPPPGTPVLRGSRTEHCTLVPGSYSPAGEAAAVGKRAG